MPKLFDIEIENANGGWENIRRGDYEIEVEMRNALEDLWAIYEPYSDANFRESFGH